MKLQPHHIGIVVSDLERSTAFYRALGFETVSEIPSEDGSRTIRFMRLGALQLEFFWYAATPQKPTPTSAKQLGFLHLALSVDDIDAALGELKAAGIVPDDIAVQDIPAGFRIAFFDDPDGLQIELTQPV